MGARLEGVDGAIREIRQQADRMLKAYLGKVDRVGLQVVRAIRESDVSYWMDQTGNLRNSIGYVLMYDGKKYSENFEETTDGKEGLQKGREFAYELAKRYPSGIVLVIVAGMEYASYVEDIESRTVLKGGERLANELIAKINAQWEAKYGRK